MPDFQNASMTAPDDRSQTPRQPQGQSKGLGAKLGFALGRAVGATMKSLSKPKRTVEVDRATQQVETRDDAGRKIVLRRTTIDEVEIEP